MIDLLIYFAIFVIIAIVIWYLLTQLELPDPLKKIIIIALVVIGAVIVIGILLNFAGHGGVPLRL